MILTKTEGQWERKTSEQQKINVITNMNCYPMNGLEMTNRREILNSPLSF